MDESNSEWVYQRRDLPRMRELPFLKIRNPFPFFRTNFLEKNKKNSNSWDFLDADRKTSLYPIPLPRPWSKQSINLTYEPSPVDSQQNILITDKYCNLISWITICSALFSVFFQSFFTYSIKSKWEWNNNSILFYRFQRSKISALSFLYLELATKKKNKLSNFIGLVCMNDMMEILGGYFWIMNESWVGGLGECVKFDI